LDLGVKLGADFAFRFKKFYGPFWPLNDAILYGKRQRANIFLANQIDFATGNKIGQFYLLLRFNKK